MKLTRVNLDDNVSRRLNNLKGKTGLPQNILCRIGLMLSLTESSIPNLEKYNQNGLELKKDVLFGDYEPLILSLVKHRAYKDGIDINDDKLMLDYFLAHLNRGAEMLCNRVSSIKDIAEMIIKNQNKHIQNINHCKI